MPSTAKHSSSNNKKHARTPCSGKRGNVKEKEDGSEFGLVPRYILKKSGRNVVAGGNRINGNRTTGNSNDHHIRGAGAVSTADSSTVVPTLVSPPRIKRQNEQHHQPQESGTPSTVNSEVSGRPTHDDGHDRPATILPEEDIARLMDETDNILDKKWFISQWTADKSLAFRREKELLLRTEGYKPVDAARRIEEHIKTKVELFKLFGNDRNSPKNSPRDSTSSNSFSSSSDETVTLMGKKISVYDIVKTEKKQVGIEDGYVQLVPTRDLQGRAILFFHYDAKLFGRQPQLFRKFLYYMMESALEDDETADQGIVLVVWNDDPAFLSILDPFWQPNVWAKIRMPYRISKLHYCQRVHDSTPYSVQEKRDRGVDLVIHQGSMHEILHGCITYGVPAHFLPLNTQSTGLSNTGMRNKHEELVETGHHLRWIELRRRIESLPYDQQQYIVLIPSRNDVLLGKNRKASMPGNVFYHQQVASHLEEYHLANTDLERDAICFEVYTAVADTHGRFLQLVEDALWEDLDQPNAQRVIRMAFNYLLMGTDDSSSSSKNGKSSTHNEYDPFDFRDVFNGQQCWNLLHCKVGPPRCW